MQWYQHALGADTLSGRRLAWMSLPSNTAVAHGTGTQLWVDEAAGRAVSTIRGYN